MAAINKLEGRNGSGIVKVAQDKNEGLLFEGRIEGEKLFAELGFFHEIEMPELMEPKHQSFARERRGHFEVARASG